MVPRRILPDTSRRPSPLRAAGGHVPGISKCVGGATQIGYFRPNVRRKIRRGDARRPGRAHVAQLIERVPLPNYLNNCGARREIIRMARGQFFIAVPIFVTGGDRFPRARLHEPSRYWEPLRFFPRDVSHDRITELPISE